MLKLRSTSARRAISSVLNCNRLSVVSLNRFYCDKKGENPESMISENDQIQEKLDTLGSSQNLGGFAKAFQKYTLPTSEVTPDAEPNQTFAALMKNSKFIDLGDPENKLVVGKIFHIVDDDLYIDFGWKFHCVCTRPAKNSSAYVRGARVKLRIKDLELSTKFLGSTKDLTLLEADCHLLGIVSSPAQPRSKV